MDATKGCDVDDEVFDSPKGWVRDHIRDYVKSAGRKGHRWHGVDTLLLTTRGRRSGKLRRTALIYRAMAAGTSSSRRRAARDPTRRGT